MTRALVVLSLLIGLGVAVGQSPAAAATGGSIAGTVTDEATGAPVPGIRVLLNDVAGGGWHAKASTDAAGGYAFGDLPAGEYRVWFFDHSGAYVDEWYADAPDASSAARVAVDGAAVSVDAALTSTAPPPTPGSLAGTVTDAMSGAGLGGIRVLVNDVVGGGWAAKVSTAPDGTWSTPELAAGEYRIWFYDHSGAYVDEWHADAPDAASATRVAVDGVTATVDADLMPAGHGGGAPACDNLGPWSDWEAPHDWTADQVATAQQLICDTRDLSANLDTVAKAEAAGYQWIGDGGGTGFGHWVHSDHLATPEIFDLTTVESVVFQQNGDGSQTLAAFMPMLPMGSTFEDIPEEWAWLPGWHVHEDLCFNADGTVAGVAGPGGSCPGSSQLVKTPPMTHIWTVMNECNDPFSGVDQHGVQCGGHSEH